jgi:uncharacterized protein (TIGR00369 family)
LRNALLRRKLDGPAAAMALPSDRRPLPAGEGPMSEGSLLSDEAVATLTGLDQLRLIVSGAVDQPTMAETLGFRLSEVAEGRAVVLARPNVAFMNPSGAIHGGWASAVLDSALGCAVHATLAPGERFATLELKVNLTRPILPDTETLSAIGTIVSRGRRVATSEARLTDGEGRVYAHGTSTCLVIGPEG